MISLRNGWVLVLLKTIQGRKSSREDLTFRNIMWAISLCSVPPLPHQLLVPILGCTMMGTENVSS
ncbi:hypothetical protein CR513_41108, partial [Mucuna pruriens]